MKKKTIIGILIISLLLISGCGLFGSQVDITPIVKTLPEVKEFLKAYPNAEIKAVLWSEKVVVENIDTIREDCEPMQIKSYWKVVLKEEEINLVVWLDVETKQPVCIYQKGKKTTEKTTEPEITEPEITEPIKETDEGSTEALPQGIDVKFTRDGFIPEEVTIAAGATLNILVEDSYGTGIFTFRIIGGEYVTVEDGEVGLLKFEEAGEYEVRSIPLQEKLTVIVTPLPQEVTPQEKDYFTAKGLFKCTATSCEDKHNQLNSKDGIFVTASEAAAVEQIRVSFNGNYGRLQIIGVTLWSDSCLILYEEPRIAATHNSKKIFEKCYPNKETEFDEIINVDTTKQLVIYPKNFIKVDYIGSVIETEAY